MFFSVATPSAPEVRPNSRVHLKPETAWRGDASDRTPGSHGPARIPSRNAGLDFLRCLAVVGVIGRHMVPHFGPVERQSVLLRAWHEVGWLGVDVFFVLSGYLISGLIFSEYARTGGFKVRRFLVRRGLKIYPAYYAFLLYGCYKLGWEGAKDIWPGLILIQNYIWMGKFGHTWSLAVEEHFYVLFALVFAFVVRCVASWRRYFVPVVISILGAGLMGRIFAVTIGVDDSAIYAESHFRMDSLLMGVLLRYLVAFGVLDPMRVSRWILLGATVLSGVWAYIIPSRDPWMLTLGLTVLPLSAAAMVLLVTRSSLGGWVRPFAWVGRHSYGIYLWHVTVLNVVLYKIGFTQHLPLVPKIVLVLVACVAVGWLMTLIVEAPILKLRDRFFPSATNPPTIEQGRDGAGQPRALAV
jgi:peptidoglycan/LPS O-acetylase OafA/YrhL